MLALDRKDREREMVSVLLADLHQRELSEAEIGEGFTAIMLSCEVLPCSCFGPFDSSWVLQFLSHALEALSDCCPPAECRIWRSKYMGLQHLYSLPRDEFDMVRGLLPAGLGAGHSGCRPLCGAVPGARHCG